MFQNVAKKMKTSQQMWKRDKTCENVAKKCENIAKKCENVAKKCT